jgi:hypothetical protein
LTSPDLDPIDEEGCETGTTKSLRGLHDQGHGAASQLDEVLREQEVYVG